MQWTHTVARSLKKKNFYAYNDYPEDQGASLSSRRARNDGSLYGKDRAFWISTTVRGGRVKRIMLKKTYERMIVRWATSYETPEILVNEGVLMFNQHDSIAIHRHSHPDHPHLSWNC